MSQPTSRVAAITKSELDAMRATPAPKIKSGVYVNSYAKTPEKPKPSEWYLRAACKDLDTKIFFDENVVPKKARDACRNCDVAELCLAYALENRLRGYWGGTSERERNRMRAKQNRKVQIVTLPAVR